MALNTHEQHVFGFWTEAIKAILHIQTSSLTCRSLTHTKQSKLPYVATSHYYLFIVGSSKCDCIIIYHSHHHSPENKTRVDLFTSKIMQKGIFKK